MNDRMNNDIKKSEEFTPVLDTIYSKLFYNYDHIDRINYKNEPNSQRSGIDVKVYLTNGNVINIEEKVADKPNFCMNIEFTSIYYDSSKSFAGWAEKDLHCNYLIYGFKYNKEFYKFDWNNFKMAYNKYKEEWLEQYEITTGYSDNYYTLCICVPIEIVNKACNEFNEVCLLTSEEKQKRLKYIEIARKQNNFKNNLSKNGF